VTWPEVKQLLRRPSFLALLGARVFGQLGDGMVQAALTTFVLFSPEAQATPSKIAVAFGVLLLPYSIFGPFIGVLIDRWPRERILIFVSLMRAFSVVLIGTVVQTGDEGVLLGVAVLVSLGLGRFMGATLSASLPHVALGRELVTANSFGPTAGTLASAIGGLIGVAIQTATGDGVIAALAVSAGLQLCSAAIAKTMPRDLLGPDSLSSGMREQMRAAFSELASGARHLAERPAALRALLVVVCHRMVFGLVTVMAIVLVRNGINLPSASNAALGDFAFVVGAAAIGAFIGASMTPIMVGRVGTRRWSAITLMIGGIGTSTLTGLTIAAPESPIAVYTLMGAALFLGWTGQCVKVCSDSITQDAVDDDHRGRVFSLYDMAVNVGLVSGIIIAAEFLAPDGRSAWALGFILVVLVSAMSLLRMPRK
jgi:MFS family permease